MNRTKRLLLVGITLTGFGCGGGDEESPAPIAPSAGGIEGAAVLFDGLDHSGTRVVLTADGVTPGERPVSTRLSFSTATDGSGHFSLKNVPSGTYVATYEHDTYAPSRVANVVVGDPAHGTLDLGRVTLTRAMLVAGGIEVVPGNKSPNQDKQLFVFDGQLEIYDHARGDLTSLGVPAVGGSMTPDGKYALVTTGTSPSVASPDAVYAVPIDGATREPVLLSANAVQAGVSPDSTHAYVLTPNGNGSNLDLWTLSFANAKTLTRAAKNLPFGALTSIPDPAFTSASAYAVPVYKQLAYDDNPQIVGSVSVHDFNLFDVNTGAITKLPKVETTSTMPLPAGAPATTPAQRLIRTVPDADGKTRDLYLFTPGGAPPVKLNNAPLAAGLAVDVASSTGHAYVLSPDATGGTAVWAFDLGASPNFHAVIPSLLWPTSNLRSTAASRGRKTPSGGYLVLARNGASVDLVSLDVDKQMAAPAQPSITRVFGIPLTSSDDLTSTQVLRTLSGSALAVTTNASATQLTPVVIDTNGAHPLTGAFDNVAFSSLALSADGSGVVFITGASTMGFAKLPAAGAVTPTLLPITGTPSAVAISPNASMLGYTAGQSAFTLAPDGGGSTTVATTASTSFTRMVVDTLGVVAVDNAGQMIVGKCGVAGTGLAALTGSSLSSVWSFGDGKRLLLHNGSSTLAEVDVTAAPSVAGTYSVASSSILMNGPRTRAVILGSGLTALNSDGTKATQIGTWAALPGVGTSLDGKTMYFRDSTGHVVAYGETGSAVEIAASLPSASSDYLRSLNAGADFAMIESVSGRYDLVAVHGDTGQKTVVVANLVASSPLFESAPSASLRPWVSVDGTTVFGLGDMGSLTTDKSPNVRLAAYTTKAVTLADDVATSPAPQLDATKTNVVFQTKKESQFGTATMLSFPIGGTAPITIAENVRTFVTSPDGKAVAAIVVKDGHLQLQSGPAGQATTVMGPLSYATLGTTNLVFSDDASRLFTFDTSSSGSMTTGGTLVTGGVGAAGLTAVTTQVLAVFSDKTGKQAAVLTRDPTHTGRVLNRYVSP